MTSTLVPPFDDQARAEMKRWLDVWKVAGPMLDAERVASLRRLTETDAARIAVELLWPMVGVGGGDSGEGLLPMRDALRRLAAQPAPPVPP